MTSNNRLNLSDGDYAKVTAIARRWGLDACPVDTDGMARLLTLVNLESDVASAHVAYLESRNRALARLERAYRELEDVLGELRRDFDYDRHFVVVRPKDDE